MSVREILQSMGLKPAEEPAELSNWKEWYKGDTDWHSYTIYNGMTRTGQKRASMHMAKQVCQDWASLIINEKAEIKVDHEMADAFLNDVLADNRFHVRANQLVELTFAFGTGAFVEYLDGDGRIIIDYVRGDLIYPLAWENGQITECAFASVQQINNKSAYYLNIHRRDDGGRYIVQNFLYDKESSKEIPLPDGLAEEVYTGSDRARFQIIRPNIVNNFDLDSPYGIAVFANAISRLKKVDLIFDSGNNEFALGKKRIILPLSMAQIQKGKALEQPVFDANDVAFYALQVEEAEKPIDLTGQIRSAEHSQGLQDALNYLSDGVGLGSGRYDYTNGSGLVTATQVISEKSDLYQNLKKHEQVMEQAIRDMCSVIFELGGLPGDLPISVNFDDSIITDKNTDIDNAIKLSGSGLMSKVSAMEDIHGWTEDQAKEELARIMEENRMAMASVDDLIDQEGDEPEETDE